MRRPKPTSALIPAAARAGSLLLDDAEVEANSQAIETFLQRVGGRAELTDTLAIGAGSGDLDKVTTLLTDPRYAHVSVKRLCTYAGITVVDLFAAYRKALVAQAHIEATKVIAGKTVAVVTDVMDKALSDPTVERHKLALELAQLTEKKGGIVMQQNTIAAGVAASVTQAGVLEQLQQVVGELAFAPRRKGGRSGVSDDGLVREPPEPRTPFTEEVEPELPFSDPRDPPVRRRPDLPGEPEERVIDADTADTDDAADDDDAGPVN